VLRAVEPDHTAAQTAAFDKWFQAVSTLDGDTSLAWVDLFI
jgi:hypothetical protein